MRELATYGLAGSLLVGTVLLGATWASPPDARLGLWVAGGVALAVQVGATAVRIRFGRRPQRLLLVWVGSAGARLAVVGGVALAVVRQPSLHPVSTLVGLAGFLFALLLLEAVLLRPGASPTIDGPSTI